jgi:hypothetical protein
MKCSSAFATSYGSGDNNQVFCSHTYATFAAVLPLQRILFLVAQPNFFAAPLANQNAPVNTVHVAK